MAIATDLFPLQMRGRVMGFLGTAFSAAQVLGLPAGLFFATHWDWHAAFWAIISVAAPAGLIIALFMKPVAEHLTLRQERSPLAHLFHTLGEPRYRLAFILTMLLPTGGYMLMPFGTAYMVNNLGISFAALPTIYLITGAFTVFVGPLVGKAADSFGKFNTFLFGSTLTIVMVAIWTNLPSAGLVTVVVVNVLMFIGIFSRMIPSQALVSAIPEVTKRGAFNSISASLQQFAGGISSAAAGAILVALPGGRLGHYNRLGFVVMGVALVSATLMYFVHKQVPEKIPGPVPR
jgi:predicted MFS family arabinose efflux permease